MSLTQRILDSVNKARVSLGDLVLTASITKTVNIGYDPDTLKPIQTTQTKEFQGFIAQWDEGEVDGTKVRSDDVKFYVFPTDVVITQNDPLNLLGIAYSVEKKSPVMVGSQVGLTMLQLRK